MGFLTTYTESLKHTIHIMLILGFGAIIMSSCKSQSKDTKYLLSIEALNDSVPEKVLTLLDSINPEEYKDKESKALYALIKSQALDKTLVDVANDSLISIAKNYYEESSDKFHLMKSEYYHGLVNINAGNYENAIKSLLKAYDLGEEIKDYYWQGMAASKIADIFNKTANCAEELEFSKVASNCLSRYHNKKYYLYSLLDLCVAYNNLGYSDSCIYIADQLKEDVLYKSDPWFAYETNNILGKALVRNGRYEDAIKVLESALRPDSIFSESIAFLGLAHLRNGEIDKGLDYLNDLNGIDSLQKQYLDYEINLELHNNDKALSSLRKLYEKSNKDLEKRLSSKLSIALLKFHNTEKDLLESNATKYKIRTGLIIVSLLLLLIIIFFIFVQISQKRKIYLLELKQKIIFLQETIKNINVNNTKLATSIKSLMSTQYKAINDACQTLYEHNDKISAQKHIAKSIIQKIESISNDEKTIISLGHLLDEHCDNIYTKFTQDYPSLSKNDFKLFLYSALGFDNIAISLFLNTNLKSIYNRRERMKVKIKESSSENRNRYIAILYPQYLKKR